MRKFGAEISEKEDGLIIHGESKFNSAEVDSEENEVSIDQLKDQEATDTSDSSENQDQ